MRKIKLMVRGDKPFRICIKVRANTYTMKLPADVNVSSTFNVGI